jgi:hypothetical protein
MGFKQFLVKLDSVYSNGKKSKCWKYNLCDFLDSVDD